MTDRIWNRIYARRFTFACSVGPGWFFFYYENEQTNKTFAKKKIRCAWRSVNWKQTIDKNLMRQHPFPKIFFRKTTTARVPNGRKTTTEIQTKLNQLPRKQRLPGKNPKPPKNSDCANKFQKPSKNCDYAEKSKNRQKTATAWKNPKPPKNCDYAEKIWKPAENCDYARYNRPENAGKTATTRTKSKIQPENRRNGTKFFFVDENFAAKKTEIFWGRKSLIERRPDLD